MAFRTNKMPVLQEKSASGAVATFNTALAMPLVNGEFTIQAYQEGSGDPSPVNVRNIIPFNAQKITKSRSKNLFDEVYPDITSTIKYRPIFIGNGVFTGSSNITSNMVYLFGGIVSEGASPTSVIRSDRSQTVTAINGYITIAYRMLSGDSPSNYHVQIERGSTATPYEPYIEPEIKTVDLGEDTYGAVYNSVTGGKDNTHALKILNGGAGELITIGAEYGTSRRFNYVTTDFKLGCPLMCNYLKNANITANSENIQAHPSDNLIVMTIHKDRLSEDSINGFRAYLAEHNLKFVYELRTPTETQLEPTPINTFNGDNNNIFCDTGDTSLTYKDLDIAKRGNFREVFKLPS